MTIVRRRYYFWLLKAYLRRWSKTIFSSIIVGALVFFVSLIAFNFYILPVFEKRIQKIGYSGSYTARNIPMQIISDVSYGLTKLNKDGSIAPAAAYKWDVKNEGKTYVFYIRRGQYFHDGRELDTTSLPLSFADVKRKNVDKYTVEFDLKSPYSPFLTLASHPLLEKNLYGLGFYKIKNIDINAGFIHTLTLVSTQNAGVKKTIIFYPTQDALKTGFALGEVDTAYNLDNSTLDNQDLSSWKNVNISRNINYSDLVTLFYNNNDSNLSDKKLREALSFAIPSRFSLGDRAYSSIPPTSIYFSKPPNYGISDIAISKNLISGNKDIGKLTLEISTTDEFLDVANIVQREWQKIGIKSKIKIVSELPQTFQVLIYPIKLPQDPDQYTLWHSAQPNNITRYNSKRIDKLLEDGRSTTDIERRQSIYSDFQKYFIDDAPATFLYFPQTYTIARR